MVALPKFLLAETAPKSVLHSLDEFSSRISRRSLRSQHETFPRSGNDPPLHVATKKEQPHKDSFIAWKSKKSKRVAPTTTTTLLTSSSIATTNVTFAVYRILGNDMWPLHGVGQTRSNAMYAIRNEPAPPSGIEMFWVINHIVNVTERALLVQDLKKLNANILFVNHSLTMIHCLSSKSARLLFAQSLNSVRNACIAHAASIGVDWVLPFDGNQFLPMGFYETMMRVFIESDTRKQSATLVPMLRVRTKQTLEKLNSKTPFADIIQEHISSDGRFQTSEPQIAFHVKRAKKSRIHFDDKVEYGSADKASLIWDLCDKHSPSAKSSGIAHCCELVYMTLKQHGHRKAYRGGEFDLNRNLNQSMRTSKEKIRKNTFKEAERIVSKCGVSVRLYNFVDSAKLHHKVATDAETRSNIRKNALEFFYRYIDVYLRHSTKPAAAMCTANAWQGVSLSQKDIETVPKARIEAMTEEIEKFKAKFY